IAKDTNGKFYCTSEYPSKNNVAPLEFSLTSKGLEIVAPTPVTKSLLKPATVAAGLTFPAAAVVPNKSAGFA
ncbi:MAG: hypothetical protein KGM99_18060, partial [Burkholderiales bacterium]|nr:hypothetical protein [Burkholderiales bacterium]